MKISDAIFQADTLRPNVIAYEQKKAWLHALEAEIAETQCVECPAWEGGEDCDLLLEHPSDYVYPLYLCPMIDFYNQDTQLYQLDAAVANNAVSDVKARYRRTNPTAAKTTYIKGVFP